MHLAPLIRDLALILGIAGITTYVFRKIRQPVVLGYIVAGLIIGPHTPPIPLVTDLPNIQVWAELGVIFLMFSLGLDFSFQKLIKVGYTSTVTAIGQILFMLLAGYLTGQSLGWRQLDCFFLGGILAISSTTIIFKAFDELGLRTRRFADHVFGILVVEDLVAIVLLVGLSVVSMTQTLWDITLLFAALRLIVVVGGWFLVGYFLIPTFLRRIGRVMDNETLTVLSTGLCLLMVAAATEFGYSSALGAFIMGSILSETREAERIESVIRPLRDLFAAVFFVSVGMLVNPRVIWDNAEMVALVTAVTIFGKIFGVTCSALLAGQTLRSSIQIGFSLGQIGEFSFIIATLGSQLGVTSSFLYPVAVAVSTITTFITPYLIRMADPFATWVERRIPKRVQHGLSRYSAWMQTPSAGGGNRSHLKASFVRFALNGILVTVIFAAVARFGLPALHTFFKDSPLVLPLCWLASILLSAPFVWGMFFSFRSPPTKGESATDLKSFLAHGFTIIWVGALSATFFPSPVSFGITLAAALLVFLLFYRKLEGSYRWFEKRLVRNVKGHVDPQEESLKSLVPWDLHLVRVGLTHHSSLVGHTLAQAQIRQRFGLNIVAIQRGDRTLGAPSAEQVLYPGDTLLVLGTDSQLQEFRAVAESSEIAGHQARLVDYSLRRVLIDDDSPFAGKTIRDSGIREKKRGLIVGLENGSFRSTNPDPNRTLVAGDVLWVVTDLS